MDKTAILDFFFPSKCVFCRQINKKGSVCAECLSRVQHYRIPQQLRQINHSTFKKLDSCISFYYYDDIVREGVLNAKKHSVTSFCSVFLEYIDFDFNSYFMDNEIDVIISMPAHKSKFYTKEYDLPMFMAKEIAKRYNVEYNNNLIKKVKRTKSQHSLTLAQRKTNLKGAFKAAEEVKGKNILLVDDITTSGTSLEEVAKTLKKSGANRVVAVTFAYRKG